MNHQNFINVSLISFPLSTDDVFKNGQKILETSSDTTSSICLYPELSLTGYSSTRFDEKELEQEVLEAIQLLMIDNNKLLIFGAPIRVEGHLYNCAVVLYKRRILGIVPKQHLTSSNEFFSEHYFKEFDGNNKTIEFLGQDVPFGSLIFENAKKDFTFGVEICEDAWRPITPSMSLSQNGAQVIFNLSATNNILIKDSKRASLVNDLALRNRVGYLYCSSGAGEDWKLNEFKPTHLASSCGREVLSDLSLRDEKISTVCLDLSEIRRKRLDLKSISNVDKCDVVEFDMDFNYELEYDPFSQYLPYIDELKEIYKEHLDYLMKSHKKVNFVYNNELQKNFISSLIEKHNCRFIKLEDYKKEHVFSVSLFTMTDYLQNKELANVDVDYALLIGLPLSLIEEAKDENLHTDIIIDRMIFSYDTKEDVMEMIGSDKEELIDRVLNNLNIDYPDGLKVLDYSLNKRFNNTYNKG